MTVPLFFYGRSFLFSQIPPKELMWKGPKEELISKINKRTFGIRIAYGTILFPKRDTFATNEYSQAYNISLCTEKQFKHGRSSYEMNIGYGMFDFKEKISALDTNVTVRPFVSKNFNTIAFTYDNLFFQFTVKIPLNKYYILGYGWDVNYYFLRTKGGYEPLTFSYWEQNKLSGLYNQTTITRDYTNYKSYFNLYLHINNQIRIDGNHSVGINISFNPYDFINISSMHLTPEYPVQSGDHDFKVYGGPGFESVFIMLCYYRLML